ncbi:MAG: radical SAM protein [Lachnotalea sp.]
MRILLINGGFGTENDNNHILTLAMYHIGGVLREAGHFIEIIDPDLYIQDNNSTSLIEKIINMSRDKEAVAISVNTFTWSYVKKYVEELRKNDYNNSIILGGVHPSRLGEYLLKTTPIDYIVKGDSETTLPQLIHAIESGNELTDVKGIIFRSGEEIVETPDAINREFDNEIPFPAYDLVPSGVYDSFTIESSRGCSGNCSFCSILSKKCWRGYSVDIAVERTFRAVKEMKDKVSSKSIVFTDDHFFENKGRAIEILDRLYKTDISNYALLVESKLKVLKDEKILNAIKKYPRISVQVGVESGYDEGLIKIKKGILRKDIFDVAEIILENQLNTNVFFSFIIGFPWETKDKILLTLKTLGALVCDYNITVNCSWWLPLPSPEFEILRSMQPEIDESLFDSATWMTSREVFLKAHPLINEKEYDEINGVIESFSEFGYDLKIPS